MRALRRPAAGRRAAASAHIPEMIELIARARSSERLRVRRRGDVYYAVEKFDGYGKLSGPRARRPREPRARRAGDGQAPPARLRAVEGGEARRAVVGVAVGAGTSRLAHRVLGDDGALPRRAVRHPRRRRADLIFPHHENEIAQSEAAHGERRSRASGCTTGIVKIGGEKMSKSLKNYVVHRRGARATTPSEVLRLFFCGAHYRSQMDYGPDALDEAKAVWERFKSFLRVAPPSDVRRVGCAARGVRRCDGRRPQHAGRAGCAARARPPRTCRDRREGHRERRPSSELRSSGGSVSSASRPTASRARTSSDRSSSCCCSSARTRERTRTSREPTRSATGSSEIGVQVEDSADGPRWFIS